MENYVDSQDLNRNDSAPDSMLQTTHVHSNMPPISEGPKSLHGHQCCYFTLAPPEFLTQLPPCPLWCLYKAIPEKAHGTTV